MIPEIARAEAGLLALRGDQVKKGIGRVTGAPRAVTFLSAAGFFRMDDTAPAE